MRTEVIAKRLNITIEQATQIKGIIKGTIDPLSFNSVSKWVNQCYNKPSNLELKLEAINEVLEGFGVEYIEAVTDNYYQEGLSYINLGDTYTATVVYDHNTGEWNYCSWGDIVESDNDMYV